MPLTERPPLRLVDDPETAPELKRDLRNSSELKLPADVRERLERIEREAWGESDGAIEHHA